MEKNHACLLKEASNRGLEKRPLKEASKRARQGASLEAMVVDPTQQREVTKWIKVRHQAFYLHVVVLHSQRLTKEGKIK